ncbi:acyltransferase family protein [Acidithiobacillus thiooxidans]
MLIRLPYEWFFYISLPVFFVALKNYKRLKISHYFLITSWVFFLYYMNKRFLGTRELIIFLFGILAYEIFITNKLEKFKEIASGKYGSLLVLVSSIFIVFLFNTAYNDYAPFLYFLIFTIISLGNNMFGLLTSGAARKLGEISYSVYLLQGFFLYIAFGVFAPGTEKPYNHWFIDLFAVFALVIFSQITFKVIEKNFMVKSENLNNKIKLFFYKKTG